MGETDNMLRNVDNLDPETLASLFFHPALEYEYIKLGKEEDGYPTYEYDQNSVLHRVVQYMEGKGYTFKTIDKIH
ncbi:MAG: hypothetical protein PHC69_02515 [Ruminiclostridium sp.]|nr:hypothetical protein [Ruminiclostridium sp.]